MIFRLTTLNQQGETREFHYQQSTLEEGFDALNKIAAKGYVLTKAVVFDGACTIELPIDAFDGQPVSSAIIALEQEWRKLLEPLNPSTYRQWVLDQRSQRIDRHETIMLMLEQAIDQTQQRLSQIQVEALREPYSSRIIHLLTLTLNRYQALLASEQTSWRKALNLR
ncbi:hypothetical protein GCM10028818_61840 [Spirosoma horti]